jgi:hypothetical protein
MTIAMDEVLTAGEVSRMTGIPVSTLHDWAAKREWGWSRRVRVTAGCRLDIGVGCALMLRNGLLQPGIER